MQQVSCTLNDGQMSERRRRWHALADRAFVDRVQTGRGLRLVFRDGDRVEEELRELAELERECCAFADWSVSGTVLDVSGTSAEGIAAVQAMFDSLSAGAHARC